MKLVLQGLPHGCKTGKLGLQLFFYRHLIICHLRKGSDIAPVGVDIDNIRLKAIKIRTTKHGILPVLAVLRLVKVSLYAIIQQKVLQLLHHLVSGRASENCYIFMNKPWLVLELSPQGIFLPDQGLCIKRVFKNVHAMTPLPKSCPPCGPRPSYSLSH